MLTLIFQMLILGVSLLIIYIFIERLRLATGREMLIDKLISYLQDIYCRSAPIDDSEVDWLESDLPFKGQVITLSIERYQKKISLYSIMQDRIKNECYTNKSILSEMIFMKYKLKLNNLGDKVIDINVSFCSGAVKIASDELIVIRQPNLNEYKVQISYEKFQILKTRRQLLGLDPIPKIILDSEEFDIAQSLHWYEYLLCCIPLILISGGAIGGFIGFMGMRLNLWIIRIKKYSIFIRIVIISLICYLCLLVFKELSKDIATTLRLLRS